MLNPYYEANIEDKTMKYGEYLGQMKRSEDFYETLELTKRDGSIRYISEPWDFLRIFQRTLLRDHLSERDLFHPAAFAYIPGTSAVECAREHAHAKWLLKIDIKDFFHQIDERQVYWSLRNREVSDFTAFFIARFVTRVIPERVDWLPSKYRRHRRHGLSKKFEVEDKRLGFLPQGAPTSGALSNLVCFDMDNQIASIAFSHGLTYTRYADDIVLSGTSEFKREFAEKILKRVVKVIRTNGFQPNLKKTRIVPPGARLQILGVLVGGGVLRLPKLTRKLIDGELRALEKFGFKKHTKHTKAENTFTVLNRVYGYLVWANDVNKDWAQPRLRKLQDLAESQLGFELNS